MGMTNRDWLFSLPLEEQIAWMESEHSEPNSDCSAMLYKTFTENMKHEPCSHYEPKDDAVSIMRECVETGHSMSVLRGRLGVECVSGWQMRCLGKLADMVERDYVRRESVEEVMDNDRALVDENSMLARELLKLRAELEKATNNLNSANEDFENARAELTAELDAAKQQISRFDAPKSVETSENHAPKREIRDFDVSERYATAFKWLDRLNYGKGGVVGGSFCDTPEQGEVVISLESLREYLGKEPDNEDSRDKIEADVRKIAEAYNMDTQRHGTERFADELYHSIIHLLNRQRAIDDSICDECSSDYYEMQEEHDQMIDGIAKLMRLKQPYTFDPGEPLENIEVIGRYIDELTAERDNLKDDLIDERGKLNRKMNALREVSRDYRNERDHYRSKFGKCIDYADAIHALMDDEGMA